MSLKVSFQDTEMTQLHTRTIQNMNFDQMQVIFSFSDLRDANNFYHAWPNWTKPIAERIREATSGALHRLNCSVFSLKDLLRRRVFRIFASHKNAFVVVKRALRIFSNPQNKACFSSASLVSLFHIRHKRALAILCNVAEFKYKEDMDESELLKHLRGLTPHKLSPIFLHFTAQRSTLFIEYLMRNGLLTALESKVLARAFTHNFEEINPRLMQLLFHHPSYTNLSSHLIAYLLDRAIVAKIPNEYIERFIHHPNFEIIAANALFNLIIHSIEFNSLRYLPVFISHRNFQNLSPFSLSLIFICIFKTGAKQLLPYFLNHPNYKNMTHDELESIFNHLWNEDAKEYFHTFYSHPNYNP